MHTIDINTYFLYIDEARCVTYIALRPPMSEYGQPSPLYVHYQHKRRRIINGSGQYSGQCSGQCSGQYCPKY